MKTHKSPYITLIGAGPGDIDLITVKGLKALKKADVILYDALVDEELLDFAPIAHKVFVGKRKGFKAYSQEEINQLIIDSAKKYGHAVRLKGGDSFVFGRGYEEIQAIQEANIDYTIVPGVSSAISVPALAGIPVTHRSVSASFHVVSATLSDGSLNPDLESFVSLNGTLVVLMGLSKLADICGLFSKIGKTETPVSIISNGSLSNQQQLSGTVENIVSLQEVAQLPAPAILVFGDVVELANQTKLQLNEKTIFA